MKKAKILTAVAFTAFVVWLLSPPPVGASNAIAEREDLACTSCHDKPGSKRLTDRGKYYELMDSLDGYVELEASFSRCTTCHVKKPGSLKLTKKGKRFQWMFQDMEGLKAFLLERHPQPAEAQDEPSPAGEEESEGRTSR